MQLTEPHPDLTSKSATASMDIGEPLSVRQETLGHMSATQTAVPARWALALARSRDRPPLSPDCGDVVSALRPGVHTGAGVPFPLVKSIPSLDR